MKRSIVLASLLFFISHTANANQDLCNTYKFKPLGEPDPESRKCWNFSEMFSVRVIIDGVNFVPQVIGLFMTQTSTMKHGDEITSLTLQVLKNTDIYTVRFHTQHNDHNGHWEGRMQPGEDRTMNVDGHLVRILFVRQVRNK